MEHNNRDKAHLKHDHRALMAQFEQIAGHMPYQQLNLPQHPDYHIDIKRLDCIHPHISGNKFFKLKYNLLEAKRLGYSKLLSFGGAYSNHIAALAYAAAYFGFESIGIIRGEELATRALNPTLKTASEHGMQLEFVSRNHYRALQQPEALAQLQLDYPEHYILPEGGSNDFAVQGCREILSLHDRESYDLICAAVGTGTTLAGIIQASAASQYVVGFSALKGDFLHAEVERYSAGHNWRILDRYCCGGYAKTTAALLRFMQDFETTHQIPLEPIYTAKMLFGLFDLMENNQLRCQMQTRIEVADPLQFNPSSARPLRILVIHSGGLQGKASFNPL